MKIYKWVGTGHHLGATIIVVADCVEAATEIIGKELSDNGLSTSWEETRHIEEIEIIDSRLIYADNGDY